MGSLNEERCLPSIAFIKRICRQVFIEEYPEIKCAYLYGSYARDEATEKSDIDILVVLDRPMGLRFYEIAGRLEKLLYKAVDVKSYECLLGNASMLKDILVEGIKIYG